MKNCMNCKYKQTMMNNLVGCKHYKKIVTNPYEIKSCCQKTNIQQLFNIFNKGFAYGQS